MKKLVFLLFIISGITAQAQDKKWTLKECVEYALENNISIKQSELNLEATDAERLAALGNFLPSLNASSSVAKNTGLSFNPTTNQPETVTFLSASGNLNMGYTLFDGLRNIRQSQRAKISQLSSQYQLAKMQDDISLFVANSYLQVILSKANLKVLKSQNEITKQQIKQTQELADAGVLPQGDVLDIVATDANEVQGIVAAENTIQIGLISLAQLLLIKDYANFDLVDEDYNIVDQGVAGKTVEEIIDAAREVRSEIKIEEQNVELALKDLQLARANYMPRLTAFFGYNTRFTNASSFVNEVDADNPIEITQIGYVEGTGQAVLSAIPNFNTVEVGADPFFNQLYLNDGISYGLSLNIPIFNGFTARSNVMRSMVNLERSKYQLEQAELDLESSVYQAFIDAEGALKSYDAALKALESQELAYEYAQERYNVGIINALDFSQSKLRFDNSIINSNRAKYDYIFKLKVLEFYFGIPISEIN